MKAEAQANKAKRAKIDFIMIVVVLKDNNVM